MTAKTIKVDLANGKSVRHSGVERISTYYGVLTIWRVGEDYTTPSFSYAPGTWLTATDVST